MFSGEVYFDDEEIPVKVSGTIQGETGRRKNEEYLKAALREKNLLLTEVHHRVKNNLAVLCALMVNELNTNFLEQAFK